MEIKEFKAERPPIIDDTHWIEGYAATFAGPNDAPDLVGDKIMKGAFQGVMAKLNSEGAPLLNQHNSSDVRDIIGRIVSAKEDDHGLYIRAELLNDPSVKDIYERMRQGLVRKFSIGYRIPENGSEIRLENNKSIRYLKQIDLAEVSIVIEPANPKADILYVKEAPKEDGTIKTNKKSRNEKLRNLKLNLLRNKVK